MMDERRDNETWILSEAFAFESRRHSGYPFAFAFYWNGVFKDRLSICCEYRCMNTMRVGGKRCLICIIKVENAKPCRRCVCVVVRRLYHSLSLSLLKMSIRRTNEEITWTISESMIDFDHLCWRVIWIVSFTSLFGNNRNRNLLQVVNQVTNENERLDLVRNHWMIQRKRNERYLIQPVQNLPPKQSPLISENHHRTIRTSQVQTTKYPIKSLRMSKVTIRTHQVRKQRHLPRIFVHSVHNPSHPMYPMQNQVAFIKELQKWQIFVRPVLNHSCSVRVLLQTRKKVHQVHNRLTRTQLIQDRNQLK